MQNEVQCEDASFRQQRVITADQQYDSRGLVTAGEYLKYIEKS